MMTGQHTPGPWFVVDRGTPTPYVATTQHVSTVYVARILGKESAKYAEANAALIAAAPELLEALNRILLAVVDEPGVHSNSVRLCHVFDIAEAAIAKARGEA